MIVSALKVREHWLELLLNGQKSYEMRSCPTRKRETIGLIQSGTDKIMGIATIADCLGPLDDAQLAATRHLHQADPELLARKNWRYAWVMEGRGVWQSRSPTNGGPAP